MCRGGFTNATLCASPNVTLYYDPARCDVQNLTAPSAL